MQTNIIYLDLGLNALFSSENLVSSDVLITLTPSLSSGLARCADQFGLDDAKGFLSNDSIAAHLQDQGAILI